MAYSLTVSYGGGTTSSLDANDGSPLSPETVTGGHEEYLFEAPEEPLMMFVPMDKNELIIKSVKAPEHDDKCSTKILAAIIHAHAHTHVHAHIRWTLKHLGCVC
jgi:hypothetical protein